MLDAEPQVFQVGINFADATQLSAPAHRRRQSALRTPDAGRYVITDAVARGPAMFDMARLDRVGGLNGTDSYPLAALHHRATAAGMHTASLDEVLCVAAG